MKTSADERLEIEERGHGLIIFVALFGKKQVLEAVQRAHNPEVYLQSTDLSGIARLRS